MFVRSFEYVRAGSVEEASTLLTQHGYAKVLAGGQSLMPMINLGLAQVDALVDISFIPNLEGVVLEDGALQLGALTRHRAVERDRTVRERQPLLAEAVRQVGNPRVRNVGTLGGSLAHNDPAAELPLVMQVLEAQCTASNGRDSRSLPAEQFFVSYFTTALREDELLIAVRVPTLAPGWGWGFHELSLRAGDFALVAAAAIARCEDGRIESLRVGLAGAADRAVRCRAFEDAALGGRVDQLEDIAGLVAQNISPLEDALVSGEYRRHLAGVLAVRAVQDACRRSDGARR